MKQKFTNQDLWAEIKSTPAIWITSLMLITGLLYFSNEILDYLFPLRHSPDFETVKINSNVEKVLYYNKGYPVIQLSDGRTLLFKIIGVEGKKYVQAGDSIVKQAQTYRVTIYRKYPTYIEMSLFGEAKGDEETDLGYAYSGLLKRERIDLKNE